ncbi:hypothetical protein HYV21_00955, partial [Candidatus Microgenomates bacterium]|nr:hypothetical protein [Candidatus Microgenomates bacterium]
MKLLPILVISLSFLVFSFRSPVSSQEPTPTPEPLDAGVHPSYGEDIDVTREVTKTG